jgi:hypothetical protein
MGQQAARKRRARSGIGALQSEWEEQGLSREAAVFELISLRREVLLCTFLVVVVYLGLSMPS